jgi:hypothetical protein
MHRSSSLVLLAALLATTACSSVVQRTFNTVPKGAFIYVNGESWGNTPVTRSVDFSLFPRTWVVIFAEGFKRWEQMYEQGNFALGQNEAIELIKERQ